MRLPALDAEDRRVLSQIGLVVFAAAVAIVGSAIVGGIAIRMFVLTSGAF